MSAQLLNEQEKAVLGRMIHQVEKMVLEDDVMFNYYMCNICKYKWKSEKDWFDISNCPKCMKNDVETLQERMGIYDIEFAFESNRDYSSYFLKYGQRIYRIDVERRLERIKTFIFNVVRERSSKRRFRRFR